MRKRCLRGQAAQLPRAAQEVASGSQLSHCQSPFSLNKVKWFQHFRILRSISLSCSHVCWHLSATLAPRRAVFSSATCEPWGCSRGKRPAPGGQCVAPSSPSPSFVPPGAYLQPPDLKQTDLKSAPRARWALALCLAGEKQAGCLWRHPEHRTMLCTSALGTSRAVGTKCWGPALTPGQPHVVLSAQPQPLQPEQHLLLRADRTGASRLCSSSISSSSYSSLIDFISAHTNI